MHWRRNLFEDGERDADVVVENMDFMMLTDMQVGWCEITLGQMCRLPCAEVPGATGVSHVLSSGVWREEDSKCHPEVEGKRNLQKAKE